MLKPPPATVPHILLIDNNRDGLLVRRCLLEEVGYQVHVADNAEEGLNLYRALVFDVVVTNYRMPRMDGPEIVRVIRRHNPNARVIMLSGYVEPLALTQENTGADAVIAKTAGEAAHLTRWVKRLVNRASRKPPASQKNRPTSSGAASG